MPYGGNVSTCLDDTIKGLEMKIEELKTMPAYTAGREYSILTDAVSMLKTLKGEIE